jgi:hypothetical protein
LREVLPLAGCRDPGQGSKPVPPGTTEPRWCLPFLSLLRGLGSLDRRDSLDSIAANSTRKCTGDFQFVPMSVFITLKQRGLNPIKTVEQALRIYITTGKLPALKEFAPEQP